MNALDAYKDMLKELDKYESPTFSIRDFNLFYNKAVSKYIDTNYAIQDIKIKDTSDIQSLIKLNHPLTLTNTGDKEIPEDFRHLLSLKVKVKFKKDMGRFKKDSSYEFWVERMKSGQKGFRFRSSYGRPKFNRYYYELSQGKFYVSFDSNTVEFVTSSPNAWIDYIIQPEAVYLNPDTASDYNNPTHNSVLIFNPLNIRNNIYYEILNVCRSLFLENIESPRTGIAIQESAVQQ